MFSSNTSHTNKRQFKNKIKVISFIHQKENSHTNLMLFLVSGITHSSVR